jgi:hypothetical protein
MRTSGANIAVALKGVLSSGRHVRRRQPAGSQDPAGGRKSPPPATGTTQQSRAAALWLIGLVSDLALDGPSVYVTAGMAVLRIDGPGAPPQVLATTSGNGARCSVAV